jgi:hypothetical protein
MTFRQFIPEIAATCINPAVTRSVEYLRSTSPPAGLAALPTELDERMSEEVSKLLKQAASYHGKYPDFVAFKRALHLTKAPRQSTHLLVTLSGWDCAKFPNINAWLIYWAALEAQHRFSSVFCGIASHEERLTGHLVSELFAARDRLQHKLGAMIAACREERADGTREVLSDLEKGLGGEFAYADLSTRRQEQHTGADIGLVLEREFSQGGHAFIPLRLQAKRSGSNGRADLKARSRPDDADQLNRLTESEIGHYLYYATESAGCGPIAPLVQSADYIARASQPLGAVNTFQESLDLASFLLRLLITEKKDLITVPTLEDAVMKIVAADVAPPGLMMAIATGRESGPPLRNVLMAACASYRQPHPDPEPPIRDVD